MDEHGNEEAVGIVREAGTVRRWVGDRDGCGDRSLARTLAVVGAQAAAPYPRVRTATTVMTVAP